MVWVDGAGAPEAQRKKNVRRARKLLEFALQRRKGFVCNSESLVVPEPRREILLLQTIHAAGDTALENGLPEAQAVFSFIAAVFSASPRLRASPLS